MPIFTRQLGKVDSLTSMEAVHKIADHVRIIQEQLEWRLSYLDSSNISEIDTGKTNVTTAKGENINNVLEDQEGNISRIEQTADEILMRVENDEGDIAQLKIRADEISMRVENDEGDIAQLKIRADEISSTVQNQDGDISQLKQRADSIASTVQNQAGDISVLQQTATSLTSTVESHTGDISQLRQTATSITAVVESQAGDISVLQQTATSLTSTIESHTGDISQLRQTATSLTSTIESQAGDISQLKQTATSLTSTVESYSGQISQIKQTSDAIALTVEDLETGMGNTLRVAADGVTITNATGGYMTINGGQVNLTGHIKFTDLHSDMQTTMSASWEDANNAKTYASSALTGLTQIANGLFQGGTFINGKNIYSPNIYGDTINLLDGTSNQVGTMTLKYSDTYAFDISSALSLRLQAGSSFNAFMGVLNGPYVLCRSAYQTGGNPVVQLGGGVLVLTDSNFGGTLPSTGTYGQTFFLFS